MRIAQTHYLRTLLWAIPLSLGGCAELNRGQVTNADGNQYERAYLVMAPLCLFICPTTFTTVGSDVDTVGDGASGATSQSSSVATGNIGRGK